MKKSVISIILIVVAIAILLVLLFLNNSSQKIVRSDNKLVVSILPLKYLVANIVGEDFIIEIIVPPGSSPETYEPTPQQLTSTSDARLIFTTGLIDFERELIHRIAKQSDNKIVDMSNGIKYLSGSCCGSQHGVKHGHTHGGIDPHIWMSPKQLKIMAQNAYEAISLLYPGNEFYENNYTQLIAKLDELDLQVENILTRCNMNHYLIYHPALTYFADDYGLHQLAIEQEGKEPSASQLRELIDVARRENIKVILYQKEFGKKVVETIAKDIGATPIEIDPLAEDVDKSILHITNNIAGLNIR